MPPQSPPDGRCPPVPSRALPLDIEAFCAHPCAPVESLTLILFPFQTLMAGLRQVIIMQELRGIGKLRPRRAGVPLLAASVCRLSPDMPRGLAAEHTRPIGWAGSVSVVGESTASKRGKMRGWFRAGVSVPPT